MKKVHLGLLLIPVALLIILVLGPILRDGMFLDGLDKPLSLRAKYFLAKMELSSLGLLYQLSNNASLRTCGRAPSNQPDPNRQHHPKKRQHQRPKALCPQGRLRRQEVSQLTRAGYFEAVGQNDGEQDASVHR